MADSSTQYLLDSDRGETSIPLELAPMTPAEAIFEANRCLYCHDAPCIGGCPASIDVPEFIRSIRTGAWKSAARIIMSSNILAETCGAVCPTEILCMGECILPRLDGQAPIAINRLHRFVLQWARENEIRVFQPKSATGKRVAVIGAGPAGISCAHELALLGHQVVLYERSSLPGGLCTTAIAPHKIHTELPLQEISRLLEVGVTFEAGIVIGKDITFSDLEGNFDAIFIGVGLGRDSRLGIPGEAGSDVFGAVAFLSSVKTGGLGCSLPWRNAIVVGGGNTAIDAARTLAELDVPNVSLLYRRDESQMKGYPQEWEAAKLKGVAGVFLRRPLEILRSDGKVSGLRVGMMTLGDKDASGRPRPIPVPGAEATIEADLVVVGIGQAGPRGMLPGLPAEIQFEGRVLLVDEQTGSTTKAGYFAGGDCVNGGMEVVNASVEGQRTARSINRYISEREN